MREAASFFAARSGNSLAGSLAESISGIRNAFRAWQNRRRLSKLKDLDDHLLADVGLTRDDLDWALHLPFAVNPVIELQRRARHGRHYGWRG